MAKLYGSVDKCILRHKSSIPSHTVIVWMIAWNHVVREIALHVTSLKLLLKIQHEVGSCTSLHIFLIKQYDWTKKKISNKSPWFTAATDDYIWTRKNRAHNQLCCSRHSRAWMRMSECNGRKKNHHRHAQRHYYSRDSKLYVFDG